MPNVAPSFIEHVSVECKRKAATVPERSKQTEENPSLHELHVLKSCFLGSDNYSKTKTLGKKVNKIDMVVHVLLEANTKMR